MDHQAITYEYVIWIKLAQDSVHWRDLTDMTMNLRDRQVTEFTDQQSDY
jgi:hypothetical protein